jgi:NADPH:quinone reductase-like Zn-dependent oxidoreductase
MKNKKAIIHTFGPPSVIQVVDDELPIPLPGQVRVRIEASTVSATDIFIRKGIYPLLKTKPPLTLGYDFVGLVDQTGEGVMKPLPGTRVSGIVMTGGNANYICVDASTLNIIPMDIDPSAAACFSLSGITAYQMFTHFAKVKAGQRLLIHGGSGAIGDTLLQLGRLYKCEMVTTASASKHAIIETYGAMAIDYHSSDYWQQLLIQKRNGFDAIFDFTNQKSFDYDRRLLKHGGTLVTYAVYSSAQKIKMKTLINFIGFGIDFATMRLKLLIWNLFSSKKAVFYGSTDSRKSDPALHQDDMNELCSLYRAGRLKPTIYRTIRLDEVKQAHQLLQDGQVQGQIVVIN